MALYLCPCSQVFRICVPVHLGAHRVAHHLIEVGDSHTGGVEELSPQKLTVEGDWRSRVFLLNQRRTCAAVRVLKRQFSRDSASVQPWQHSPLYKHQTASTRRCAQTGSQKSHTDWERWCWDLTSLETSEASQSCTPSPKNTRNPNKHTSVRTCTRPCWWLSHAPVPFFSCALPVSSKPPAPLLGTSPLGDLQGHGPGPPGWGSHTSAHGLLNKACSHLWKSIIDLNQLPSTQAVHKTIW